MFEGKGKRQGSGAGWTKGEQSRRRRPLLDGWSLQLQQVRARSGRVCGLWLAVVCRRGMPLCHPLQGPPAPALCSTAMPSALGGEVRGNVHPWMYGASTFATRAGGCPPSAVVREATATCKVQGLGHCRNRLCIITQLLLSTYLDSEGDLT